MIKWKQIYDVLTAAALAAAVFSCDKPAWPDGVVEHGDKPVIFRTEDNWGDSPATRGMASLTEGILKDRHFGVFALYTGAEDFNNETADPLMWLDNKEFADYPEGSDTYWRGTDAYWPLDPTAKMSFFAYAPYSENLDDQIQIDPDYAADKTGPLKILYTPSTTNITNQLDFCVADASQTLNKTFTDGTMPLSFAHTLTKVQFYARYSGELPSESYKIRIEELKLKNIIGSKTLTYDITPSDDIVYTWSEDDSSLERVDYHLRRSSLHMSDIYLDKKSGNQEGFQMVQDINGSIYLLPQTLSEASIDIVYSFIDNNIVISQFNQSNNLPNSTWEAGKIMNYKITIDLGDSSMIIIESDGGNMINDWQDSGKEPDNEIL